MLFRHRRCVRGHAAPSGGEPAAHQRLAEGERGAEEDAWEVPAFIRHSARTTDRKHPLLTTASVSSRTRKPPGASGKIFLDYLQKNPFDFSIRSH